MPITTSTKTIKAINPLFLERNRFIRSLIGRILGSGLLSWDFTQEAVAGVGLGAGGCDCPDGGDGAWPFGDGGWPLGDGGWPFEAGGWPLGAGGWFPVGEDPGFC